MGEQILIIGVVGGGSCSEGIYQMAEKVGEEIAKRGAYLICGGRGGVMEAACKGAKSAGGITIGILPGSEREQANPWIDIPIVTGLGQARNLIIVKSAQAIISINGKFGTLSEIAFALKEGIPIVGLKSWEISEKIIVVRTPEEAVREVFKRRATRFRN